MAATGTAADVDLAEVYQDLHAHPELGFTETRTAGIVGGPRP
jgi:metal-dependent amidase/aminoacylase/carboxypeptidase family protein